MIYKCKDCGILWTSKNSTTKIDPSTASSKQCSDCQDFDYPVWNKRIEQVRSWLTDPKKKDKKDDKVKKSPVR